MNDQNSSQFKIGADEESPDSLFQAEIADQRVDKLNQRLTIFAILIPCLVCIILFVYYLDMKKRFITVQGAGEKNVQNLSENLESTYASQSQRFAKLEETINNKISSIEKSTALLKKNLEKLEKDDKAINKTLKKIIASKSEKKDVNRAIAETNKKLDPIQTDLTKFTSDFKQELERVSGTVDATNRKIDKFQADLATLSSDLIGPKELALALKAEQIIYQRKLTQTSKNLEDQIAATRKALKELDRLLKLSKLQRPVKSEGSVTAEKLEVKPASPETSPEFGKIIEQDIQ